MPMVFRSWEEIDFVGQTLRPAIERRFRDKGFVVALWAEAGWVRFFCKQSAVRPEDLKPRRMFAWAGDNEQVELMKGLGFRPVVLETADIIPGLQPDRRRSGVHASGVGGHDAGGPKRSSTIRAPGGSRIACLSNARRRRGDHGHGAART
jgi:hypothetical protein